MNDILKIILLLMLIVSIYFIQFTIVNDRMLFGVKPNLILITLVVISLYYEIIYVGIFSLISGIILDIMYNNVYENFGSFTLLYTIIAIIIYFMRKKYLKNNMTSTIYLIIIATVLFEVFEYFYHIICYSTSIKLYIILLRTILSIILNSALGFIVYSLISKLQIKDSKAVYFK